MKTYYVVVLTLKTLGMLYLQISQVVRVTNSIRYKVSVKTNAYWYIRVIIVDGEKK